MAALWADWLGLVNEDEIKRHDMDFDAYWKTVDPQNCESAESKMFAQHAWGAGRTAEREQCAKFLEGQRYMTLEPLRTYTADEVWQTVRSTVTHLAKLVRGLKA
jgi:hypothetical protein